MVCNLNFMANFAAQNKRFCNRLYTFCEQRYELNKLIPIQIREILIENYGVSYAPQNNMVLRISNLNSDSENLFYIFSDKLFYFGSADYFHKTTNNDNYQSNLLTLKCFRHKKLWFIQYKK